MPELPEVATLRRVLGELTNRRLTRVELSAIAALKTFDPSIDQLVGGSIGAISRRGKHLVIEVVDSPAGKKVNKDAVFLVVHLARGGWIKFHKELKPGRAKPGRGPLALRLGFDDGSGIDITEAGTEKRLAIWVVENVDSIDSVSSLGPDPLDEGIDELELANLLMNQKGQIKRVLTTQSVIAGVGNAYSDEALHAAKLSPFKNAEKLTDVEALGLVRAIRTVMSSAVDRAAKLEASQLKADKKSNLAVHGRTGEPCPVCGDVVREVSYATKSFQYCATCQTGGKILADRRMSRLLK